MHKKELSAGEAPFSMAVRKTVAILKLIDEIFLTIFAIPPSAGLLMV
jgi:hypothetical protein